MATETQGVTKDMIVAEVIEKYPIAADIMQSYGLSCTGCSVSTVDSIEVGAKGHGIQDERIDEMVAEINTAIASGNSGQKTEQSQEGPIKPINVTDKAVEKMKAILTEQKKEGWGIRVQASAGGCAGYTYGMDFVEKPNDDDQVQDRNGLKVFVDSQSAKLLSGMTVDFVETLQESGFKFDNPNATSSCGCGKSFN